MLSFRNILNVEFFTGKVPLFIGTLLVVSSSHYEVFSNYIDALKAMFNLTQSDVEWLGTANIAAALSSILAGVVHDNKGAMVSLLTGMVTWSAGVILLCWSVFMISVVEIPFSLLLAGMLLWAHGRTYFFITGMVTLVHVVSPRYKPIMSSYAELSTSFGTLMYVLIYDNLFHNSHVLDAQNQNILGFFEMQVFVAVFGCVISIFGLFGCSNKSDPQTFVECLKPESQCDLNSIEEYILLNNSNSACSNNPNYGSNELDLVNDLKNCVMDMDENSSVKSELAFAKQESEINIPQSVWFIMFGMQFLLYLVAMTLVSAETIFFSLHVSILAKCLGFPLQERAMITIYRAVAVGGLLSGLVTMLLSQKPYLPFCLLQMGCLLSLSGYLCMAFATTQIWTLYFSAVAQGLSYGLIMSMFVGIMENFSSRYLATLFGVVSTSIVVVLLIIQPIFGALYIAQIPQDSGSNYCYGPACLRITLRILVSLSVISNCVCLALVIIKYRRTSE